MGSVDDHLPLISMVSMQILYAIMALLNRAALVKGMSSTVFIFYRQAIATLVISPVAYFARKGQDSRSSMGIKSFLWIFVTAFIGVVLNQTMYFEGLYLASSSIASATYNLIPAVTFLIAAALGLEKMNGKLVRSLAKILGAILGVGGAICMALLRGPKLLNSQLSAVSNSMLLQLMGDESNTWLVPVTAVYPDHLSLSAWMCFFSTLQAGILGLVLERDPVAWNLNSTLELTCIFVSGVFGSGVQFFVQSWCISRRGPFYAAMFTPLATVITTVLACLFLREQIYTGSLVGAVAVIIGLYVVLWGKSEETKVKVVDLGSDHSVDKTSPQRSDEMDLEESLLPNYTSHKREET
ncbi:hypothetical protein KSS87_003100 [Heliosperma pusillum]|nr:hypothetical protein KSS87_003100 [Heliosperma pusillum]